MHNINTTFSSNTNDKKIIDKNILRYKKYTKDIV